MKWADYCVSKVKYNSRRTHIDSVIAVVDLGEKLGESKEMPRSEVIEKISSGKSFITMTLGATRWNKGQLLKVVKIGGTEFIKTTADQNTADNLGELSEY